MSQVGHNSLIYLGAIKVENFSVVVNLHVLLEVHEMDKIGTSPLYSLVLPCFLLLFGHADAFPGVLQVNVPHDFALSTLFQETLEKGHNCDTCIYDWQDNPSASTPCNNRLLLSCSSVCYRHLKTWSTSMVIILDQVV